MDTTQKPEISIVVPAIRVARWRTMYDSIVTATKRPFEVVLVGPAKPPEWIYNFFNIKYVKDHGNPARASNIGAELCEGRFLTWFTDDGVMFPNNLDIMIDELEAMGDSGTVDTAPAVKNIIISKYLEGNTPNKPLQPDAYFKFSNSPISGPYMPPDWWIFNVAIMYREYFEYLGGWDAEYETTTGCHLDLAVRAQADGARVQMSSVVMSDTDWMPGRSGDHAPIHDAIGEHDFPLLETRYRFNPNWRSSNPSKIPMDNWKKADTIWERRHSV